MEQRFSRINNFYLMVLAFVAITVGLIYTKPIMVPFVISFFLFSIISLVNRLFQEKLRFPRPLAMLVTITLFLLIAFIVTLFLINSVENFIRSSAIYRDKIAAFISWVNGYLEQAGIELNTSTLKNELFNSSSFNIISNITGGAFGLAGNLTLVIIFTLFLLAGSRPTRSHPLIAEIHVKVARYLSTKFMTSLTTGVLVGIILLSFNVDLALMFGVLTFLLNFIPSLGSIMATLLPLPIVLLQFGLGWKFYIILILTGSIQMSVGNIIEPKLMGENLNLHPVVILFFLMFWGLVWGAPGMFLAVPITAIIKIVMERIEATREYAKILTGDIPDMGSD